MGKHLIRKKKIGESYDQVSGGWEKKINDPFGYHFWSYGVFDRVVKEYVGNARSLLDVGCGTGSWLKRQKSDLSNRLCVGIEISVKMAVASRKRSGCHIVIADSQRQPFKDEIFDLVVSRGDAIIQAYDPLEAMKEVYRILANGGHVCFEMSWGRNVFEGLIQDDGEVVYRKDLIVPGEVEIVAIRTYHLPGRLKGKAEAELGDKGFLHQEWPEEELATSDHIGESHLLVGSEENVRALLRKSALELEKIDGTGVLGWLVSTGKLSKGIVERLRMHSDISLDMAAILSEHVDIRKCQRATIIGSRKN